MIRKRYEYKWGGKILKGDLDQIAEYTHVPRHQLKAQQREFGNPRCLEERNTMYDLMDWDTEEVMQNVPFESLNAIWPIKDVREYSRNYRDGYVSRKTNLSIINIKRRPIEVILL